MGNNSQARKWALVFNNPLEYGMDHKMIVDILKRFTPTYYCLSDEIASTGTFHTHVFIYSESPIRFTTIKNRFPTAHIEKAYGTVRENREYIRKEGKWAETEKSETSVPDSFLEWGVIPSEVAEKNPKLSRLIEAVKSGESTTDILAQSPDYALRVKDIEILRQTLLAEKYASEFRTVEITYLYGPESFQITKKIYAENEPKEIYRATNYRESKGLLFDGYQAHDVMVFEGFQSQIPVENMLNFLEGFPLRLPARYNDRVACYTKVYITSAISPAEQYQAIQRSRPDLFRTFLNHLQNVFYVSESGEAVKVDL